MYQVRRILAVLSVTIGLLAGAGVSYAAQADTPLIYGFMTASNEWLNDSSNPVSQFGFYTFKADGSTSFVAVSPIGPDNDWASQGGVYANRKYYCYSVSGNWMMYTLKFTVIDTDTWSVSGSNSFSYKNSEKESEASQKAYLVPSDLAYDVINDVVYAVARRYQSQDDSYLCRVNPDNGELTRVVAIPPMAALTADSEGKIYGIGIDGNLYSVSPESGATVISHTGMYPSDGLVQSATTDFKTGDLYWSCFAFSSNDDRKYNRNAVLGVVKVNPLTAESSLIWTYPGDERFTSVSIMNPHPNSPADITDFQFKPASFESTDALFSFTVPTVTATGVSISEPLTVKCYIDNELKSTETAMPGTVYTKTVSGVEAGMRQGAVDVSRGEYVGNKVFANAYFGVDKPAKISAVTLSADDSKCVATVSWNAPTLGENGSEFDVSKIRYKVVRYPDGAIVKRSLKETSFTDNITYEYARTYYEVSPYHVDHPSDLGRTTRSNVVMMGTDITMPYYQSFNDATSFDSYTTIDANGDGSDDWEAHCWKYDPQYACAFYYGGQVTADDWLITPPMKFNHDRLYRLTYKYYGYYGYGNHFRVVLGSDAVVEKMDRVLQDMEVVSSMYDYPGIEQSVLFSVREGDRMIGFHHISGTIEHLSIDDIVIEDAGDARVPSQVTSLQGTRIGDYAVSLTFNLPTKTAADELLADEDLKVYIYRGTSESPVVELSGKPGAALDWVDYDAVKDMNDYEICAANTFGNGLRSTISVDLSDGVPVALTGVVARYINDRQIEITWNPSSEDVDENGNPIDLDNVRYLVYKPVSTDSGYEYKLIGRDLSECRYVDDEPLSGLPDGQQVVQYYVAPVNGAGTGMASVSSGVLVGDAYSLPFAETWRNQEQSTAPWTKPMNNGATWYIRHKGYDPICDGQDGYGVLSCEVNYGNTSGLGAIMSPRIDLTTKSNPELTFYMWRSPDYSDGAMLAVAVSTEGENSNNLTYVSGAFLAKAETAGWEKKTISLSDFADNDRVSILLIASTVTDNCIHVDNLQIDGDDITGTVRPMYVTGEDDCQANATYIYTGTVCNLRMSDAAEVKVLLKANDATVATATIPSISAGEKATAEFEFTPTEQHVGTTVLSMQIESDGCDSRAVTKEIKVAPVCKAVIEDLAAQSDASGVVLTWSVPTVTTEPYTVIDGFEAYDDFVIDGLGGWTTYDGDGFLPFTFSDGAGGIIEWPNVKSPQAFMVFNPSLISISVPFAPNSGSKFIVNWSSPYGANNDWIISPELPGGSQLISFYASAAMSGEKEQFYVMVSRSDKDPQNFISLTGSTPVTASEAWQLYHYVLPEGAKYFAIRYVSNQQTGLMVDDVMFYGYHTSVAPDSYNIYRNGVKINQVPVTVREYSDSDLSDGESYVYTVRPVYNGNESDDSNEVTVAYSGIGTITGDNACVTVTGETGAISVSGAEGMTVEVFTVDGRSVVRIVADAQTTIPVPAGFYLVKVGSTNATKVVVR